MTESEKALSDRIKKCENQIETLRNDLTKVDKSQVESTTKLDNVLLELGRLRESIEALKNRPAKMWEKLVYALIGAAAAGFMTMIIN